MPSLEKEQFVTNQNASRVLTCLALHHAPDFWETTIQRDNIIGMNVYVKKMLRTSVVDFILPKTVWSVWEEAHWLQAIFKWTSPEALLQNCYMMGEMSNTGEMTVWFDRPSNGALSEKGPKRANFPTTGNQYSSFTVMLTCTPDGKVLHPLIVFRRKAQPKKTFTRNIVVWVHRKGFMNQWLMLKWRNDGWRNKIAFLLAKPVLRFTIRKMGTKPIFWFIWYLFLHI